MCSASSITTLQAYVQALPTIGVSHTTTFPYKHATKDRRLYSTYWHTQDSIMEGFEGPKAKRGWGFWRCGSQPLPYQLKGLGSAVGPAFPARFPRPPNDFHIFQVHCMYGVSCCIGAFCSGIGGSWSWLPHSLRFSTPVTQFYTWYIMHFTRTLALVILGKLSIRAAFHYYTFLGLLTLHTSTKRAWLTTYAYRVDQSWRCSR